MIYITGDTHIPIDIHKLSAKRFREQSSMTNDDCVIICGDFGGVWNGSNEDKYWINWLKNKKFTTLFADGNHENFELLNALPKIEYRGGTVHKVDDGVYHLMRGEVYNISGKKLFVFGGAASHDREFRIEGKNWWKAEMPSENEYKNAEKNLRANNYCVDYIITHCAPTSVQRTISFEYQSNRLTDFFENIKDNVVYDKWFFGHYHKDMSVDERFTAVYEDIIRIV